jgi:hypothetical protein
MTGFDSCLDVSEASRNGHAFLKCGKTINAERTSAFALAA